MPIIANSRPATFDALSFAFFLSAWQLLFSLPLVVREASSANRGILARTVGAKLQRRALTVVVLTGAMFGVSTYLYVVAVERAGAVSAAIAIQAYPLFAILWETLFLGRRKTALELLFTACLLAALVHQATGGTWRIEGFSIWFAVAVGVPFLWSVAHVVIKEVLDRTPISPAQVVFLRVLVSSLLLVIILLIASGPERVLQDLASPAFQKFAALMGLVYYLELLFWFRAVRHIDVSMAASITVPWPVVTTVLAVLVLGEQVDGAQVVTLAVVVASIYGLLFAAARKRHALAG